MKIFLHYSQRECNWSRENSKIPTEKKNEYFFGECVNEFDFLL